MLAELRPPVFWGRGTADPIIPAAAVDRTAEWLPLHTTPTVRIYEDLAHSISTEELGEFTAFLSSTPDLRRQSALLAEQLGRW